ncbi:MAG: lipopolysaccharide heptosyltransferase II [Deltaproteobacteria bacterium]|nr:lipopolysaccharide heptosyltransferase II [Deltaproteobacteria bacterium]
MSKTKEPKEIKRILVRAPNWIGDAVMCLPAVAALKAAYPDAEITALTRGRAVPVFENNPAIAEVMEYDANGRHKGVTGRLRLRKEIKARGFDMAVLFQNAFDAAFVSFISGIPERIGYVRDLRRRFLTRPVAATAEIKKRHQVFYYLNIIKELDAAEASKPPTPVIRLKDEEIRWADEFLRQNGIKKEAEPPEGAQPLQGALIGAAPGASYGPAKRWPAAGFAEVLRRLSEEYNGVPVIFGGVDDAGACRDAAELIAGRVINLAGRTTLRQCMALLSRLKVFVTNDSGLMHVAAALGVPTVAVFGSTDAALTGPVGRAARVVEKKIECAPCFKRECAYGHYRCLKGVDAADVIKAARSLLKEAGKNGACD